MSRVESYKNNEVMTSNKVKIIVMLYEGAINFLNVAKEKMISGDLGGRAIYLDKSAAIISELLCSLDAKNGGKIAANLTGLYHFMLQEISQANLQDEETHIDTVISLLSILKEGWDDVSKREYRIARERSAGSRQTMSRSLTSVKI